MKTVLEYYRSDFKIEHTVISTGKILKYCPNCHFTDEEFYDYYGSRYGLVTRFKCKQCGGYVTIVDGDCRPPIRYYFRQSEKDTAGKMPLCSGISTVIKYEEHYGLTPAYFRYFEECTNSLLLPILREDSKKLYLEDIVVKAEKIVIDLYGEIIPFTNNHVFLTKTPQIYQRWLSIWHSADIQRK